MQTLSATVSSGMRARYSELAGRVRELAAPLSEEQFWQKPFPFGNSFGHLVLHLTGNLNYYIGAQIAQSVYRNLTTNQSQNGLHVTNKP